jgi:hypothetical protein
MSALYTQLLHSDDKKEEEKENDSPLLSITALQRQHKPLQGKGSGRCD